jgi:hypothetical protein
MLFLNVYSAALFSFHVLTKDFPLPCLIAAHQPWIFLLGRPTWCSQSEATRLDWRPGMKRMKAT